MKARSALRMWMVALVCSFLSYPLLGRADSVDPGRSASARALFEQGVAHVDREEWAPAADAFRRALLLRDSQVIRYNLAAALLELGKLVEASELLHAVQVDPAVDATLKQSAADKLTELKPRLARLTIHAETIVDGLLVQLDGVELAVAQLDVPLMVDPGKHTISARVHEEPLDEQTVEMNEGGDGLVNLRAPQPKPESVFGPPPEPPVVAPAPVLTVTTAPVTETPQPASLPPLDTAPVEKSRAKLWWGVAVGGAGAIAFVTLMVLFVPRNHGGQSGARGDFDPPAVNVTVPQ